MPGIGPARRTVSERDMSKRFGGLGAAGRHMGSARRGGMDRERAEEIGIAALGFLSEEPQRLGRFLSLSGMSPGELTTQASEPHMLAAILAYVLNDESLLLVFAAEKQIDPEHVTPAQMLLEGGGRPPGEV